MDARTLLGRRGEDVAAEMYAGMGYSVVARNYRCSQGEIDVICRRGDLVVFCEVKSRRTDRFGEPSSAVDRRKQIRLRRLAGHWLRENPGRWNVRFDVVSVIFRGAQPEVTHIPDAF